MRKPSTPKMPSSSPIAQRNSKRGGLRFRWFGVGSFGPKCSKSPWRISTKFWISFNRSSKLRYMVKNIGANFGDDLLHALNYLGMILLRLQLKI